MTNISFLPGGEVRAIYSDDFPFREVFPGAIPQRASRIEVIQDGRNRGRFCVDFSLLADATNNNDYRVCLAKTFEKYGDANRAEVEWLKENYIRN